MTKERRRNGAFLMIGGVILLVGTVAAVIFTELAALTAIAAVVPATVLFYIGYKSFSATDSDLLYDQSTTILNREASTTAFWVLIGSIMIDDFFGVIPSERLHTSLIYIGFSTLLVSFLYHKIENKENTSIPDSPE